MNFGHIWIRLAQMIHKHGDKVENSEKEMQFRVLIVITSFDVYILIAEPRGIKDGLRETLKC